MKIEGYAVRELEPGVKVYTRKNAPHTTYDQEHPWIHFHYGKNDMEAERDGATEVELCCHGCGISLWVGSTFPATQHVIDRATEIRKEFVKNHAEHGDAIYIEGDHGIVTELAKKLSHHPLTFLCPDFRKQTFFMSI